MGNRGTESDLAGKLVRRLDFLGRRSAEDNEKCGSWPPRVFCRLPGPSTPSEEPETASPISCHPAPYASCCCPHRALTHWGTPPHKHTLSQGEVEASPPPPHVHTATVSTTTAPPSKRGGPSLSWFPGFRLPDSFQSRPHCC